MVVADILEVVGLLVVVGFVVVVLEVGFEVVEVADFFLAFAFLYEPAGLILPELTHSSLIKSTDQKIDLPLQRL